MVRGLLAFVIVVFLTSAALHAGGLLGDAISAVGNVVAPGSNIGQPLDDLNKQLKQDVPAYGNSATVRNIARESLVETAGPALAAAIQASRNDTLNGGVQDVPFEIRNIMASFYGSDVAACVRYRIGQGGDLAIASNAFRYGDAIAITLVDLIVFRDGTTAQDLSVWAHELQHVQQYRAWGLMDFAKNYVRDYQAVENPAYAVQANFVAWYQTNVAGGYSQQVSMPPQPQMSSVCGTPMGACVISGFAPVSTPCWCGTVSGPVNGQLIPQ